MAALEVHATDLEIVDALQIAPRASWAMVARALDVSEVTVARRWKSLEDRGLAWTSVALHPSTSQGAFIEVRCDAKYLDRLLASLGRHPDVITVGQTTGDYNLFCITIATVLEEVLRCVHGGLPELLDAVQMRISLFRQMTGGVDWRQGILSASNEKQLQEEHHSKRPESISPLSISDRQLFLQLGRDGRRSPAELGRNLGRSPGSVRRRLAELEAQNQVVFRCDVARPAFDLPLGMLVLMKAPPLEAEGTARLLGRRRETRFCASVIGTANIILVVGLHDLADAERVLGELSQDHPSAEVLDRRVITRMAKIYGRILDPAGRSVGVVPVDPWIRSIRNGGSAEGSTAPAGLG
ncbi:AsnC family transcriptional regulator [Arthrobacter sp. Helios]|uniref:Lrp/AsnC family transcriptional regulator n=1 Tax=Arthrobacter sp. Helios TaxID=2828862 RepID=UPI00205D7A11|nr:AsnC family transcriptional regulator [Arthrobacter sp. Helios]UPO76134.1 Lrp/AsnC family transcriptional regulator [Arthrobacter sp. Helios]